VGIELAADSEEIAKKDVYFSCSSSTKVLYKAKLIHLYKQRC
jgi:hypothetical protein